MTSKLEQRTAHVPFYDTDPQTGVSIEVFYADRALETFSTRGAGWFWWARRRGFSPAGRRSGGPSDWPICYELRSIAKRDEYAGTDFWVTARAPSPRVNDHRLR